MSCINTTAMYLNVSTDICASASASRSGSTVTVSGTFSVSQGSTWNYNAIYAYVDGQTSWTKVKPYKSDGGGSWSANFSFSFNDSNAGTRNYNAIFQVWNNAESGTVGDAASVGFSVSYGAADSAPTGLSVTNIVRGQDYFTANVSITGWGVGSGTRYRELQVWTQGMVEPRRYQPAYGDSLSGNITCNNSSNGSLTIMPNTMYTLGIYATNGSVAAGSYNANDYTTLPPTPTISCIGTTTKTATFTYSVPNQGGKYDMTLKKQVDGGTAETITTLSGSGTKAGTFTLSGLTPGTSHTITAALNTAAGEVVSNTVNFTTAAPSPKIYGPFPRALVGIGSVSIAADTHPAVTAVDKDVLCAKINDTSDIVAKIADGYTVSNVKYLIRSIDGWRGDVQVTLTDGVTYSRSSQVDQTGELAMAFLAEWGGTAITPTDQQLLSTVTLVNPLYSGTTKEIKGLYGSVNGQTKRIKKLYGSVNGQTKLVYRYVDPGAPIGGSN